MFTRIIFALILLASMGLISCGIDDNPVTSEPVVTETELTVIVTIQPLASLRTTDTWTYWTTPVVIPFVVELTGAGEAEEGGHDDGDAHKLSAVMAEGDEILVGTAEVSGMSITVKIEDGEDMFEIEHGGEMHEHHAETGDHHVVVEVIETATGHSAHGDAVVSHAEITIIAISETTGDTTEIELVGVQSGHGYRYESNVALPYDEYDLHVEAESPSFYRNEETQTRWVDHAEFEFHGWEFDSTTTGSVGTTQLWVGAAGDSLELSLRVGAVKTYGAVGIGEIPLAGDETINFSVKLSDPTTEAHGQPLFGSVVSVSIHNGTTQEDVTSLMEPMWGEHGFHFGQNMMLNLGHVMGGEDHDDDDDDGHGGH